MASPDKEVNATTLIYGESTVLGQAIKPEVVLLVEDCNAERIRTSLLLQKQGYEVIEANNGVAALEQLKQRSVDLIVTDWSMPEMDGLTLCQRIKSDQAAPPHILLLTARTSKGELVAAIDNGADDYLCKPFNAEELRVRVLAGMRLSRMREMIKQQNQKLRLALEQETKLNAIMQQGLAAAAKLQRAALPQMNTCINQISIAYYLKPAQGVAGDNFSIFAISSIHTAFFHLHVAGHGVRAAILSYAIARYLHEHARRFNAGTGELDMCSPGQVMMALNREFQCQEQGTDYFTLVYGVIDSVSGSGVLAQAGHPHPFTVSGEGQVRRLGVGGVPVGLFHNAKFDETPFVMHPNSRLVLYSDGLWECKTADGSRFNEKMLAQVLGALASVSIRKLQQQLDVIMHRLISDTEPQHDMSFFFLERCVTPTDQD